MADIKEIIQQFSDERMLDYVSRKAGTRARPGFNFSCLNKQGHPGGDARPSANVFKAKDGHYWYHCYSCGLHGNLINIYRSENPHKVAEKVTVIMNEISAELGCQPPVLPSMKETSPILKAYRIASTYVKQCGDLSGHLKSRRIDKATAEKFAIGSIPDFQSFTDHLTKFFTYDQLKEFGLANATVFNENNIIMTIHNRQGFPVAFVARNCGVVDDKHPKYCNTKTTEIYSKSETLFLFHDAKSAAIQEKSLYIVEGYIDAVTLHRESINHTCAMGGVALTHAHIEMAKSLGVNEIIFSWDNDPVGVKTTLRKVSEIFADCKGIRIRFVVVPTEYKDADGIITAKGKQAFLDLPKLDLLEYMATVLRPEPGDVDLSQYFENIYENMRYVSLNPFKIPEYVRLLGNATALPEASVKIALSHEVNKMQHISDRYMTTLDKITNEKAPEFYLDSSGRPVAVGTAHKLKALDIPHVFSTLWQIAEADATVQFILVATSDGYRRLAQDMNPEQLATVAKMNIIMYNLRDVGDETTFQILGDIREKYKDTNYLIVMDLQCISQEAERTMDRTRLIQFNLPF